MSVDRLSNMLSSLRNAFLVGKEFVEVPYTKECEDVAKILEDKEFLTGVKVFKEKGKAYKKLRLDIAYEVSGVPKITDMKRVSTPGKRIYRGAKDLKLVAGGFGVLIVSTSRGIITGKEARSRNLGGEVLCSLW